jgi:hypothetical protein
MGIVPSFSQSTPVPPALLGLWSASSVDAIRSVQQQECSALTISERRIRLSTIPGTHKFQGELIRTATDIWMTTDNRNCRLFPEDSSSEPMFQATWAYVLDAVYDATRGVMNVDGRFAYCNGNCGRFVTASARKPFHTELKMNHDHLVDTNMTDDPGDDVEFVRISNETGRTGDAKTALATWLKILDAGDFGRFYDQATSASFRSTASRKDFIDRLSTQRERMGSTTSRQTLQTLYVQHAPFISKSPGEYVLFWSGVESTKSARELEFMLLVKDGGTWKVTWLNYGS